MENAYLAMRWMSGRRTCVTEFDLAKVSIEERVELLKLLRGDKPFQPLPGPQEEACESPADIVGYGGAAGGG